MKSMFGLFTLAAVMSFWIGQLDTCGRRNGCTRPSDNQGDVLKIDGEYYVVKDSTGKEVRLHVDKTSKLEKDPRPETRSKPR